MLKSEKDLIILYEGEEKHIHIKSSLKELEEEFIKEFKISENFPFYLYYKFDNDCDIILDEDSFSELTELNITKIFAEKIIEDNKEINIINDIKNRNVNSDFDLLIKELEKEIIKSRKLSGQTENDKNIIIKSKESEVQYISIKNTFKEKENKNLIQELKNKISDLLEINNKLKEKEKKYEVDIQKMKHNNKKDDKIINQISFQFNQQKNLESKEKEKEIEFLIIENKKLIEENKKFMEQIDIQNKKIKELNNLESDYKRIIDNKENEIKNLELFLKDKTEEVKDKTKRLKKLKKEVYSLEGELNSKSQIRLLEINNRFNINIMSNLNIPSKTKSKSMPLNSLSKDVKYINSKKNKRAKLINELNKLKRKSIAKSASIVEVDDDSDEMEKNKTSIKIKWSKKM